MKKLLRFTLLTVFVATSLQVSAKFYPAYKNAPKMHIGVRGGITFSTMDYGNAEVLTAPYGGLAVDFKVAKLPIYVETGAYYMDKGRERTEGVDGCYVCAPVSEALSDGLLKALASSERTKGAERIVKDRLDALSISKRIAEIYETVKKRS